MSLYARYGDAADGMDKLEIGSVEVSESVWGE